MGLRFKMATCLAGFLLAASAAQAQVITVTSGHKAGNPATAQPSGTFSMPASMDSWRVQVDYGNLAMGAFTQWVGPAADTRPVVFNALLGGNGTWGPTNQENLVNPPAGLYVRAILQKKVGAGPWNPIYTVYATCP